MGDRYWVGPGIKADGFDNRDATNSSFAKTPDNAALRMTGDMELVVKCQAVDWTPSTAGVLLLCGKGNVSQSTINYEIVLNQAGTLSFHRPSGATARMFTSSVATGFTDGTTPYWIKIEYKQNNGGVSECKFYTSTDGSVFTQLGSTQTNATVTAGNSNTTGFHVGNVTDSNAPWIGVISRVTVRSSVAGTIVYDADFEAASVGVSSFTESSSNGFTVNVQGIGLWDATAGTKWSTTSGGVGGSSVPTAADNVYLDTYISGCTINANAVCRSINCTGYTGTLTQSNTFLLTIGDSTAGAGNVALKFVAGMTYTCTTPGVITFVSTSAIVQTVDFANKTTKGGTTFNASSGGSWQYTGGHTETNSVNLTKGTLDINGQSCAWRVFTCTSGQTRSLILGSSTITLNGAGINAGWNLTTSALTLSAASSTIVCSGTNFDFQGGGATYGTVNFTGTITTFHKLQGTNTFGTLTFTGTALRAWTIQLLANQTVTGTFTVAGNSAINRILVQSDTLGTARTITAATVSCSNVDFMDITGAGAGSWNLAAITGLSGDCGGNTGITFTTASAQTHTTSAGGNWSDSTKWTSRVPLPQDDVTVNGNTSGTLTVDMPRLGRDITLTGFSGTLALSGTISTFTSYGSVTLSSGMTFTGTGTYAVGGRGTHTITCSGKNFPVTIFSLSGQSGTYTLSDAFSATGIFAAQAVLGTFNSADYTLTIGNFSHGNGMTVNFGTSIINLTMATDGGYLWLIGNGNFPCDASLATVNVVTASETSRYVLTQGVSARRIGTLNYTVANSSGALVLNGANTITTLNVGSGRLLKFSASATQTITNWNVNGVVSAPLYLPGGGNHSLTVPDSATISLTGDMDLRFYGAATDWSRVGFSGALASKSSSSPNVGWVWYLNAAGTMVLTISSNGTAVTKSFVSTAAVPFGDGVAGWVRVTLDINDGSGNTVCKFWTSSDGSAWSQLGTTLTSAGVTASQFDTTSSLQIATQGTATGFKGYLYRFQMRNNILDDGSGIVFDADFTTKTWGSDTVIDSVNGAVVTLAGTARAGDGRVHFESLTNGTFEALSVSSGDITSTNLVIKDNHAAGGATFTAIDSINVSGNTGWVFVSGWVPKTIMIM